MKLKAYGKHKASIKDWGVPDSEAHFDALRKAVMAAASESIQWALEEAEWHFSFPAEWGDTDGRRGPAPPPMTIVITTPFGSDEEEPEFSCDMTEIVMEMIEMHEAGCCPGNPIEDDEGRRALKAIADGFASLASMLNEALARKVRP